jgi:hypothetical protein
LRATEKSYQVDRLHQRERTADWPSFLHMTPNDATGIAGLGPRERPSDEEVDHGDAALGGWLLCLRLGGRLAPVWRLERQLQHRALFDGSPRLTRAGGMNHGTCHGAFLSLWVATESCNSQTRCAIAHGFGAGAAILAHLAGPGKFPAHMTPVPSRETETAVSLRGSPWQHQSPSVDNWMLIQIANRATDNQLGSECQCRGNSVLEVDHDPAVLLALQASKFAITEVENRLVRVRPNRA